MNSDKLKNDLSERETISAGEQKISRLIGGLDKVSAPKDFDFHVKARIAAAKETPVQPTIWQTLRYILPLTATVIIAGFVLMQTGLFSSSGEQPLIVENPNRETPAVTDNFAPNTQIAETSNSPAVANNAETEKMPESFPVKPNFENEIKAKNSLKEQNKTQPKPSPEDDSSGSRTLAQRPSNVNISPTEMSGNTATVNKDFNQSVSVSAREILEILGVETEYAGNKLRVKSVKEKSSAEKSGVKKGDLIEAIDGQNLKQGNLPPNFTGGKIVTVLRGEKTLKIELKPN